MRLHLTAATCLTVAAAFLIYTVLAYCSAVDANAYTLGAADGQSTDPAAAVALGARTYRVVMDPNLPLEHYAPTLDAYRAAGMRPQLVIGGTGTTERGAHGKNWKTINYAVKAFRRWPDAFSVSVINEPNEAGPGACQYGRTFNRAYRMLKAAGVPRVLFGEWSPTNPQAWTDAILDRCHLKVTADGFAWHCYDAAPGWTGGIGNAPKIKHWLKARRPLLHTRRGNALPMFCTEYGAITRYWNAQVALPSPQQGAALWAHALRIARAHLAEIVAWGVHEAPAASAWDSSLFDAVGRPRPAFGVVASAAR